MHCTGIHVISWQLCYFSYNELCEEDWCPTEYILPYMFSAIIRNLGKQLPQKYNIELL